MPAGLQQTYTKNVREFEKANNEGRKYKKEPGRKTGNSAEAKRVLKIKGKPGNNKNGVRLRMYMKERSDER